MSYLLEIVGRGLLAELSAAFRGTFVDDGVIETATLKQLAKLHPTDIHHLNRFGVRLLRENLAVEACVTFEQSLDQNHDDITALLGLACAYDEVNRLPDAIETLRDAVALQPHESAIVFALGFCVEKSGDIEEARSLYLQAADLAPELRNAHERLGAIYLRLGNLDEAIDHYEQLCFAEPGDISLSLALANLHMTAGNYPEAIQRYQYALTIDPDNWEAADEIVQAYEQTGQYDEAILHLQKLIADQPGFADHHVQLGDIYSKKGDSARAMVQYREAVKLNPDYLEAFVKIGTLHLRDGNHLESAKAFNNAVELNDRLLTAYVGLGVAQLQNGESEEAQSTFEMASSVEPNSTMLFGEIARLQLKASIGSQIKKHLGPEQAAQIESETQERESEQSGASIDLVKHQVQRYEKAIERHPTASSVAPRGE